MRTEGVRMVIPVRLGYFTLAACLGLASHASARAAAPKDIDESVKRGVRYLKERADQSLGASNGEDDNIPGARALMGLALLEAGVPAGDPAAKVLAGHAPTASST